jgi:hypothetical protein
MNFSAIYFWSLLQKCSDHIQFLFVADILGPKVKLIALQYMFR